MRNIAHPGLPDPQRLFAIPTRVRSIQSTTSCGLTLLEALTEIVDKFQVKSAAFRLNGGSFSPFSYVMPALSKSTEHAVYFSDTFKVAGEIELETASVTFGQRDGQPWLHCHAVWIEPSGRRHCGHLLPDQVLVAKSISVAGVGLLDAAFTVTPDTETHFSLFMPESTTADSALDIQLNDDTHQAFAIRLAPNQDISQAIGDFCRSRRIKSAEIHGGVGSTIGAVFQDGRIVEPFVTELLIRAGRVQSTTDGSPSAEIDIAMVDYQGGISEGRLAAGANPVLVTAELVLCPTTEFTP